MDIKSISVFVMFIIGCVHSLQYAGASFNINGGFSCGIMTDAQIDQKLDDACDKKFPGSRNIRGTELQQGKWAAIVGLPAFPTWPFAPSCPGCGLTCPNGGRACAVFGASWSIDNDPKWANNHGAAVLSAECVWDNPPQPSHCDYNYAFVVDESGSVGPANYQASIDFIIDLVENHIAKSAQLMSLSYGSNHDWVYRFSQAQLPREKVNANDPNRIIDELRLEKADYNGGGTRTKEAVQTTINEFEGKGYTDHNILILVTDGIPNTSPCPQPILDALDNNKIRVIVVGVGSFNPTAVECLVRGGPADIIDIDDFIFDTVIERLEQTKAICSCDENGLDVACNSDEECSTRFGDCMMCCKGTKKCHKRPEFKV